MLSGDGARQGCVHREWWLLWPQPVLPVLRSSAQGRPRSGGSSRSSMALWSGTRGRLSFGTGRDRPRCGSRADAPWSVARRCGSEGQGRPPCPARLARPSAEAAGPPPAARRRVRPVSHGMIFHFSPEKVAKRPAFPAARSARTPARWSRRTRSSSGAAAACRRGAPPAGPWASGGAVHTWTAAPARGGRLPQCAHLRADCSRSRQRRAGAPSPSVYTVAGVWAQRCANCSCPASGAQPSTLRKASGIRGS